MASEQVNVKRELNENEKELFEKIQREDVSEVIRVLNEGQVRVGCLDEHGMSPLGHAAFRGKSEVCELLLDRGANVNCDEHDQGYTALMFAALSGNTEVVALLLAAGASPSAINAVGRNAAQMAAFVGNHECVSVINNWVPLKEVEYYAEIHSEIEKEPTLPRSLVSPLHRLLCTINVHPVAVVLFLQLNPSLTESRSKVMDVLRLSCEKEAKKNDANEVLALKYHFVGRSIDACCKMADTIAKKRGCAFSDALDDVVRHWLRTMDDGQVHNLERFVRQAVCDFPYPRFPLIQQLVRTVASSKGCELEDEQSAIVLVTATICGQRMGAVGSDTVRQCATCATRTKATKKCSACKSVYYCQQKCQKLHWFVHKTKCRSLAAEYRADQRKMEEERRRERENAKDGGEREAGLVDVVSLKSENGDE